MLHLIGRSWLRLLGWKLHGLTEFPSKLVFIAAPHTSNWDLPHMLAAAWALRLRVCWLGKDSLFTAPLFGRLMRSLGGIPVKRGSPKATVSRVAELFATRRSMTLAVPPEGTRGKTEYWRSGFYYIAREAGVPIGLAFLDYGRRRCGVGELLEPTGDVAADMDRIRAFYRDVRGRYPKREGTPRLRDEPADRVETVGIAAESSEP